VSYQEAKTAALEWLRLRGWPERMKGFVVQLIEFANDADARFFYPGKNSKFFAMTMKSVRTFCRARGAAIERVKLRPADYRAGIVAEFDPRSEDEWARIDTPQRRLAYAEHAQRILHSPPEAGEK
jgi:hypothetical protein